MAHGDEPADLVLRNLQLVDVLNHQVYSAMIPIGDGCIAAIDDACCGNQEHDLQGGYLCLGLIDAYAHIETAWCALPGTPGLWLVTVMASPHEFANVLGLAGILWQMFSVVILVCCYFLSRFDPFWVVLKFYSMVRLCVKCLLSEGL